MLTRNEIKAEIKRRMDEAKARCNDPEAKNLDKMQDAMRVSTLASLLEFIIDDELADAKANIERIESLSRPRPI